MDEPEDLTPPMELAPEDEELAPEDEEETALRDRLFRAKDQLVGLAEGTAGLVDDPDLCQDLAEQVKPYADRLSALHDLLQPIDRLIEKRRRAEGDIAPEVAQLEELSQDSSTGIDPTILKAVQAELDQLRKDRKITAVVRVEEDRPTPGRRLRQLPVAERLRRIFGPRFIDPKRLGQLLGAALPPGETQRLIAGLDEFWAQVFTTPQLTAHVEANHLKTLQQAFRDYALICRLPQLPGPRGPQPCTIETLRQRFRKLFLKIPVPALWYSRLDFFRQPLPNAHWALVDRQYLNCTFKKPGLRLLIYARANELPLRLMRHKSALEDTYDRVVMRLALGEPFFANCNSITRTAYQLVGEEGSKQVYLFHKDGCICISGKRGLPHWRPTRPRWPGVLPALVLPVS